MSGSIFTANYLVWVQIERGKGKERKKIIVAFALFSHPIFVRVHPGSSLSSVPSACYRLEKNDTVMSLNPIFESPELLSISFHFNQANVSTLMLFGLLIFLLCVECSFVGCSGSHKRAPHMNATQQKQKRGGKNIEIEVKKTFFMPPREREIRWSVEWKWKTQVERKVCLLYFLVLHNMWGRRRWKSEKSLLPFLFSPSFSSLCLWIFHKKKTERNFPRPPIFAHRLLFAILLCSGHLQW